MLEEKHVKPEARLAAIEHVLEMTLAMTYTSMKVSPDYVRTLHNGFLDTLQNEAFPGATPVESDLISSEVEEAVRTLLEGAELRLQKIYDSAQKRQ